MVAASTPDETERRWAAENLDGVQIFSDYDEMLEKADLDAVVVASVTAVHAEQTLKAIERGYHVLCEKPLSLDVEVVSPFRSFQEKFYSLLRSIHLYRPNRLSMPMGSHSKSAPTKRSCAVSPAVSTHRTATHMRG